MTLVVSMEFFHILQHTKVFQSCSHALQSFWARYCRYGYSKIEINIKKGVSTTTWLVLMEFFRTL